MFAFPSENEAKSFVRRFAHLYGSPCMRDEAFVYAVTEQSDYEGANALASEYSGIMVIHNT